MTEEEPNTYAQIVKSSSVIGGAQGISYVIGMVRIKLVAVLLGPSGIGLIALYVAATETVRIASGMGLGTSGVREVAEAHGSGNDEKIAKTVKTLRRASWFSGMLGWLLTLVLALPLSWWIFGSGEYAIPIAILGVVCLLESLTGAQKSILQGTRRIGDLARFNVLSVIVSSIVAVGIYAWLGLQGIVPALISFSLIALLFSWLFARKVQISEVKMKWIDTWNNSRRLLRLGMAFMWNALFTSMVALVIRSCIIKTLGLDANGIFQAAWAISGVFAGFVLGAMGMDFFPRLTAAAEDNRRVNQLTNEQTEIGILLTMPGLLGMLTFTPWLMQILYSSKFHAGAELLPWFLLGVFGQVVCFPMVYILAAKGVASRWILVNGLAEVLRLVLSLLFLQWFGLWGAAVAVPVLYVFHTGLVYVVCHQLTGFGWTKATCHLILLFGVLVGSVFILQRLLTNFQSATIGLLIILLAGVMSLRGLSRRLGVAHPAVRFACRFPGGKRACGV